MNMKIGITFSKLATFTSPVTTKFKLTLPDLTLRDMIRLYFNLIWFLISGDFQAENSCGPQYTEVGGGPFNTFEPVLQKKMLLKM